jgi:Uma2 family endonuclease
MFSLIRIKTICFAWFASFAVNSALETFPLQLETHRMSRPYEEILNGGTLPRSAPGDRHETICARLHREMGASIAGLNSVQLLAPRTQVPLARTTAFCPDLALVMAASGKLFLAAEIISRDDHRADTVTKKEIYEQHRVPRLWMIDPRYDNVEIYHSFEFGLKLHGILAGSEVLAEKTFPQFRIVIRDLFAA